MFRKKRSSQPSVVGLELDASHVAAAEVSVDGALTLTRGAVAELRPGIVRDGEVVDPIGLAEALKALFAEHELPKRVRLGIAHQRIVVRTLDLPSVIDDPKALAAAVRVAAPDHIPMPMEEAILDFQSLGVVPGPGGGLRSRVVVVAVRKEMVERAAAAVQGAGLDVEGIDLSAFAMVRALASEHEGALLYVNVAGLTNVAVADASGCLFTRAAAGGTEAIAQSLATKRGLTLEHARQWMSHVGLVAPVEGVEGDLDLVSATRATLEDGIVQLADTIRTSLNFYRTQDNSLPVELGVVTGAAVTIPGFAERLSEHLHLPLEPRTVATAEDADAGRLTVAAGLAVAERP
ncbi:MAG TPA: pilus assembly protein PilM [Solirubrobacteraceae bacterium]|nr:pilus assembly protein PilM [Solirubrobacteraceae bacterium]